MFFSARVEILQVATLIKWQHSDHKMLCKALVYTTCIQALQKIQGLYWSLFFSVLCIQHVYKLYRKYRDLNGPYYSQYYVYSMYINLKTMSFKSYDKFTVVR